MKKILSFLIIFIFCGINFVRSTHTTIEEGYELLRIHIRANSNDKDDQSVKLLVRDAVAQYLSSALRTASSLEKAKQIVSDKLTDRENSSVCNVFQNSHNQSSVNTSLSASR